MLCWNDIDGEQVDSLDFMSRTDWNVNKQDTTPYIHSSWLWIKYVVESPAPNTGQHAAQCHRFSWLKHTWSNTKLILTTCNCGNFTLAAVLIAFFPQYYNPFLEFSPENISLVMFFCSYCQQISRKDQSQHWLYLPTSIVCISKSDKSSSSVP